MQKLGMWFLDKIGGIIVGAIMMGSIQGLHGWVVGNPNLSTLVITVAVTGTLGVVALVAARSAGTDGTTELVINRATYGTASHTQDVTDQVRARVIDNRLNFKVGTDALGDPFPNQFKELTVEYTAARVRLHKVIPQDTWISLP